MKTNNKQAYVNWILLTLFYSYQYLLRIYPGSFTDEICGTFSITANEIATLTACYVGVYSCLQIPIGILLDRIGIRKLIIISFALCLAGEYLFSHVHSFEGARWGRVIIGIGGAPTFISVVKLASDSFSGKICGLLIGITAAFSNIFGIMGNVVLKKICLNIHSWQIAVGYLNGIGVAIFILCLLFLKPDKIEEKAIKRAKFFKSLMTVIFNYKIFLYAILTIGCCSVVITLADLWGTSFLAIKYQLFSLQAVECNQLIYTGILVGSIILPILFNREKKILIGVRFACLALGILFAFLIYGPNSVPNIALQTLWFAMGLFSSADILCFALAAQLSTPQTSGLIVGWVNTINMIGLACLQKFVGITLDRCWAGDLDSNGLRIYRTDDYELALRVLLITTLICLLIACLMRVKKSKINGKAR